MPKQLEEHQDGNVQIVHLEELKPNSHNAVFVGCWVTLVHNANNPKLDQMLGNCATMQQKQLKQFHLPSFNLNAGTFFSRCASMRPDPKDFLGKKVSFLWGPENHTNMRKKPRRNACGDRLFESDRHEDCGISRFGNPFSAIPDGFLPTTNATQVGKLAGCVWEFLKIFLFLLCEDFY